MPGRHGSRTAELWGRSQVLCQPLGALLYWAIIVLRRQETRQRLCGSPWWREARCGVRTVQFDFVLCFIAAATGLYAFNCVRLESFLSICKYLISIIIKDFVCDYNVSSLEENLTLQYVPRIHTETLREQADVKMFSLRNGSSASIC